MKIVLATGGTGGHLFPALATAKELTAVGHRVIFCGDFKKNQGLIEEQGYTVIRIDSKGITSLNPVKIFLALFNSFTAVFRALKHLYGIKPDVVCGFGCYSAFPIVLAAIVLRIPCIIHEQNVQPGKANKLLAFFVSKIAVSFVQSRQFFPEGKTVFTGCPITLEIPAKNKTDLLKEYGLKSEFKTILVFGGSQGSQKFNRDLVDILVQSRNKYEFQVIHLSGYKDLETVKEKYSRSGITAQVFDFSTKMGELYTMADLVIGRSGAMTVFELAMFKKAAILIPYPHAGGHQIYNAQVLEQSGAAKLVEDKYFSSGEVSSAVEGFLNGTSILADKTVDSDIYQPDAAKQLAREIFVCR
ncbi:MAG: undecaprenyldiphospho-muramoylpentapeptide beta-N-acetylglucosaminyltransferase [Candidatus Omnitrophica bacterium]|nr:undecaprenyldiphospho-muramoylpentapeptide beta-N-acetylglucosaminyltransferase [Candidatus Omnitrophota bacterium]